MGYSCKRESGGLCWRACLDEVADGGVLGGAVWTAGDDARWGKDDAAVGWRSVSGATWKEVGDSAFRWKLVACRLSQQRLVVQRRAGAGTVAETIASVPCAAPCINASSTTPIRAQLRPRARPPRRRLPLCGAVIGAPDPDGDRSCVPLGRVLLHVVALVHQLTGDGQFSLSSSVRSLKRCSYRRPR